MSANERKTQIIESVIARCIPEDPIGNVMRVIEKGKQLEQMCAGLVEALREAKDEIDTCERCSANTEMTQLVDTALSNWAKLQEGKESK